MPSRALPVLLAAALGGCQPPPPRQALDLDTLRLQVRQLASIAAETDLLAQELSAGHLNGSFAWVQQQALGEQVGKAAAELARPAPAGLQRAQRHAVEVAGALQLAVSRVAAAQDDPAGLQALRRDLSGLHAQMRQITVVSQ
jgi:hypothetical protein